MDKEKFCFGCNDGGDYFKREDIKDIWENKKGLKEYHEVDNEAIGFHYGYSYFKDKFPRIIVDSEKGTLYGIIDVQEYLNGLSLNPTH